ncbi:hypothetical protein BGZ80_000442, partial [Entomortierella chlamydospora]
AGVSKKRTAGILISGSERVAKVLIEEDDTDDNVQASCSIDKAAESQLQQVRIDDDDFTDPDQHGDYYKDDDYTNDVFVTRQRFDKEDTEERGSCGSYVRGFEITGNGLGNCRSSKCVLLSLPSGA